MKKNFLALTAALLWQMAAIGRASPTLQVTFSNSNPGLSWTGAYGSILVQSTTNLVRPIVWADGGTAGGALSLLTETSAIISTLTKPQEFFRMTPALPVFQFAIFYNVNLEIDPGAAMTIDGPIYCNQNIWEGSSVVTFASTVAAAGTNAPQIPNPFAMNFNGSGASTFSLPGQPVSLVPKLTLAGFGPGTNTAAMRSFLELPPPPYSMGTSAAYSADGMAYAANGADLVISNFYTGTNDGLFTPTGTNLMAYFQDSSLTLLPYDFYIITNGNTHAIFATNQVSPTLLGPKTNIYFAGFSWVTNAVFYDWREGWNGGSGPPKRVEAVQLDVGRLNRWLTNYSAVNSGYTADQTKSAHSGHHISSIYVYTSVALTTSQLPAVRLVNGAALPGSLGPIDGFTVATPFPIYVWGDYNSQDATGSALGSTNTAHTHPAALMGDSVTVLSDNWNDSVTTKMASSSSTTVNAALYAGIVPSDPNLNQSYSGGFENVIRLLENWGGTLTYNGSVVVPFYSNYATNRWLPTGNYFNAPMRRWSFDRNFKNVNKLPPLTPSVKNYVTP